MRKIIKVIVSSLLIVGLVGCNSDGSKKPTLENQKSDNNANENLMEMSVVSASIDKSGKETTEKFLFYVPTSKYADVYGNNAYSSQYGVTVDVSINDYIFEEGQYADDALKFMKEGIMNGPYILEIIKEPKIDVDEKREFAYFSTLVIEESYDNKGKIIYDYVAAKELNSEQRIFIQITIDPSKCNKLTDSLISEIEEYYGIQLDFNLDEAEKAVENFNSNLPSTKRYDAYGFSFEIPFTYRLDYEQSNYSTDDYVFGPDGEATNDNNLHVMLISDDTYSYTKEELEKDIEILFLDSEEGKAQIIESDFTAANKAVVRFKLSGNGEYLDGYMVNFKDHIVYFGTISSLSEMPQEQLDMIHDAIQSFNVK